MTTFLKRAHSDTLHTLQARWQYSVVAVQAFWTALFVPLMVANGIVALHT